MYKLSSFSYSFNGSSKKIFLESELTFNRGETIAIVGPSGGGKTTFLKILKGIIPEYSSGVLNGEVFFNGHPLSGKYFQENLKRILYLFQNPFSQLIYPTTEEEFLFSMENFNFSKEEMTKEKEKFEKLFSLQNLWGKKTSQLSNGECQKLVLASLLAINPEVLLLDEPTAFLDPKGRKEFYSFLHEIKKDRLLIIVDHHVEEIRDMVNRFIHVSVDGRVTEETSMPTPVFIERVSTPIELPKIEEARFELKKVCFSYGKEQDLLKNVSAKFHQGENVAIKGQNGIGKSTLFKLMSGVLSPNAGDVVMEIGKNIFVNNKNFSNVGFIFQNPEAHFFFDTIEEELKQSFKKLKSDDLKASLLKNFFHSIDLKKSPFLLSEGEKRRLSILMTVFLGKTLLLYDEPTFGQDRKSIEEISSLMKELKKIGLIQLMISHDESFISKVANRVMVLEGGSLHEVP